MFGTHNLSVVGAAVLPEASFANPTLTAIALGQRLAHHLSDQPTGRESEAGRLMERLVFGCSRLAGGASASASARLLSAALDAGVRTVDCAPNYGLGLAETVVGRVLHGRSDIEVIAKLGSRRDRLAWPKSWLREAKRRLRPSTPRSHVNFHPREPVARYGTGDFTAEGLRASFAVARRRLGKIDALLLHDCGPGEYTPEVGAVLAELAQAAGARPGYANSAVFDPDTDRAFPPGGVAECAIDPRWLTGAAAPPDRPGLVLHSLVPTGDWLVRTDANFAAALTRAAALLPGVDTATGRMAALYALAAVRVPQARLVFASSNPARLEALLAAFAAIDREALAPRIADLFAVTPTAGSSAAGRGGPARRAPA